MTDEQLKLVSGAVTGVIIVLVYVHIVALWARSDFMKADPTLSKAQAYWKAVSSLYKFLGAGTLIVSGLLLLVWLVTKMTWLHDLSFRLVKAIFA